MITHISIKDFAIIEALEVDFHKGLNIITGETGAGKSIIIEAMSMALGGRADKTYVRTGAEKAIIQMVASQMNEETVLTREISSEGKNLCKINGEIVTLSQLNEFCQKITDVHGQYAHQSLLNPDNHIKLVDAYEKESITSAKKRVSQLFDDYQDISRRLTSMINETRENRRKKDFMEYELNEILQANLTPGEDKLLEEQLIYLRNKERIYQNLEIAYGIARSDSRSALEVLSDIQKTLKPISGMSRDAANLEDEFTDIYYRVEDLCTKIRDAKDKIVFSDQDLRDLTERDDYIENIKRKYGMTIEEILDYAQKLEKDLLAIENMDSDIESLQVEKIRVEEMLQEESARLTHLRKASAKSLEEKITKELVDLNFQDAKLNIKVLKLPKYTNEGVDSIEFLIRTNKGSDLKPLSKIASGGEMSRIMLAFKSVIGDYDGIPTMVFDEIDSGISGATASVVGKKLMDISQKHQIISITHLPQIAAYGDHHYRIVKTTDDHMTYTTIQPLSDKEKVEEIARLLSGINISDTTVKSARELIELAGKQ
jgi:DNA repair protein RecN (Recombination protein N)